MATFLISKIINNDEGNGCGMSENNEAVSNWAGRWGEYYKLQQMLLEQARRRETLELPKEYTYDPRATG